MSRLARALAQGVLLLSLAASASAWAGQKQLVILTTTWTASRRPR